MLTTLMPMPISEQEKVEDLSLVYSEEQSLQAIRDD
jgi:hypothetical protein